jgi:hypothetical protein
MVTLERYVAVCQPLKAKSLCTFGRARNCVLAIGTSALIYNIPRFLETTWHSVYDAGAGEVRTEVTATKLRNNKTYIGIYITWMYLVVMYIIPFTCLAAFNLIIYRRIRNANAERALLSRLQRRELRLATMLLIVVIVFFCCNVLAFVINIMEMVDIRVSGLIQISNLLVTFNSSVNFVIYCIFGEKFKRLFCHLFCRRRSDAASGSSIHMSHRRRATWSNPSRFKGDRQECPKRRTIQCYSSNYRFDVPMKPCP